MTPTPARRYRLTPADRQAAILQAAINLAELDGYRTLTIQRVARVASVSPALVSHYYWTRDIMLTAVMEEAVRREVLNVIAEGLAHRHPAAMAAPPELQQAAVATLVGGA
jgi:AcrR family transcriptional regulator